ncbi:hypothetical protein [Methylobacterium fujisawaense]|uniref:hypothetical protein n=1 Tax=Methylobacterium fujisawaense TaxID=107400 RepID=UPI00313E78F9
MSATSSTWSTGKALPASQVAEMHALAEEGLSRSDIAAITGLSYHTVRKYVGHIVRGEPGRPVDVARYRRMLKAAASAGYGERDAIANRFGLKDANVLRVVLVTARRRVSEADRSSGEKEIRR